jgi:hypothetical protein
MVVDDIAPASGQDRRPSRLDPTIAAYACVHSGMWGPVCRWRRERRSAGKALPLPQATALLRSSRGYLYAAVRPAESSRIWGLSVPRSGGPSVDSANVSSRTKWVSVGPEALIESSRVGKSMALARVTPAASGGGACAGCFEWGPGDRVARTQIEVREGADRGA